MREQIRQWPRGEKKPRRTRRVEPLMEDLESRLLMDAVHGVFAASALAQLRRNGAIQLGNDLQSLAPSPLAKFLPPSVGSLYSTQIPMGWGVAGLTSPSSSWATPASIRSNYNMQNFAAFGGSIYDGIGLVTGDGAGQTIAIVIWGHDPKIGSDLDAFDNYYGTTSSGPTLYAMYGPSTSFLTVYAQSSADGQYYPTDSLPSQYLPTDAGNSQVGTDGEISLDVEWAHVAAPAAKIVLVEAQVGTQGPASSDLEAAVNFAKQLPGVTLVSMSWGGADATFSISDSALSQPNVTFVASTGDTGSYANPARKTYALPPSYVTGSGLGGTNDSFTPWTAETTSTDFTFRTYVLNDTTAKQAGISIRNGTSGTATNVPNVSLLARPGNTSGGSFQYRLSTGGTTTVTNVSSAKVGTWLAVQRQGTTYSAYTSSDGITWTLIKAINVPSMSGNVTIDIFGAGTSPSNFVDFAGMSETYSSQTSAQSPATSPNVIAVGGGGWGNGAASYALGGGGGGFSSFEPRPSFQNGVSTSAYRSIPDVSLNPGIPPVVIYDTDNATPNAPWSGATGTSFSAPFVAGMLACVDQVRSLVGLPPLTSSQSVAQAIPSAQTLLYNLTIGLGANLGDVTSGSIGDYSAHAGYDQVSGLGVPSYGFDQSDLETWVQNGTFETGALYNAALGLGWSSSGAVTVVSGQGYLTNGYSARIGGAASGSIWQVVNGLQPNTTYEIQMRGMLTQFGPSGQFTVSDYGGVALTATPFYSTIGYDLRKLIFTTGPSSTSAKITISQAASVGYLYADSISLVQLAPAMNWGFEQGTLNNWTASGSAQITGAADANSGAHALKLGDASSVSQSLRSDLQTSVSYQVSISGKVDAGTATLTFGNFSVTFDTNTYTQKSFTTVGTGGTFTLSSATGPGAYAYFDDFTVTEID